MAFVDEITLHISAGRGGDGVVRWRHEKNREYGGPSGGDGGNGGSVYLRAVRDLGILARYRSIKKFQAEHGEHGKSNDMHGKNGENLIVDLPVGSLVINRKTSERFELLRDGEQVLVLSGGHGGLGNIHFKGPVNQQPKESTPGKAGEQGDFYIELQLIADAGLVGLPNAGKSSLLNVLTRANAKVGSYAFTTLEPNLGVMNDYILADIPGLIEGASLGRGLGHKFLRHIRRTKVLLHCISVEHASDFEETYFVVRGELSKFDPELLKKEEIILLTKTDTGDAGEVKKLLKAARKHSKTVYQVSILDDRSIKHLSEGLTTFLEALADSKMTP